MSRLTGGGVSGGHLWDKSECYTGSRTIRTMHLADHLGFFSPLALVVCMLIFLVEWGTKETPDFGKHGQQSNTRKIQRFENYELCSLRKMFVPTQRSLHFSIRNSHTVTCQGYSVRYPPVCRWHNILPLQDQKSNEGKGDQPKHSYDRRVSRN